MSKTIETTGRTVWARYNGVSIAVTPATEEYARTYYCCGEPFEHDWRRPGDEVYPNCEHIACANTGEIIMLSKRIPIKQKPVYACLALVNKSTMFMPVVTYREIPAWDWENFQNGDELLAVYDFADDIGWDHNYLFGADIVDEKFDEGRLLDGLAVRHAYAYLRDHNLEVIRV